MVTVNVFVLGSRMHILHRGYRKESIRYFCIRQ